MHSNSPAESDALADRPGTLYIVATPIGNMEDITIRALRVLECADLIAAEDTRHTGRLLGRHGLKGRLVAFHEHNEARQAPVLLARLAAGLSVAVVTDAGTPGVSDPGFRLVKQAVDSGIPVTPVPGASAAIAALSVSGLPTDTFTFVGFTDRKRGKRRRRLEAIRDFPGTLIFFESPKRLVALLRDLLAELGNRQAVLGREMTKLHEEFLRGSLRQMLDLLAARPEIRGECTLLVAGTPEEASADLNRMIPELTRRLDAGYASLSQLAREVARNTGVPRKLVYEEALKLQRKTKSHDDKNGSL
jgi:16S rRNA (cytidine1402-2'-O)-methyltransferase